MKYKTDILILVAVILLVIVMLFTLKVTVDTNDKVHEINTTLNSWTLDTP